MQTKNKLFKICKTKGAFGDIYFILERKKFLFFEYWKEIKTPLFYNVNEAFDHIRENYITYSISFDLR